VALSIRKSWESLRRQAAVARSVQFARGLRPWSLSLIFLYNMEDKYFDSTLIVLKRNSSQGHGIYPRTGSSSADARCTPLHDKSVFALTIKMICIVFILVRYVFLCQKTLFKAYIACGQAQPKFYSLPRIGMQRIIFFQIPTEFRPFLRGGIGIKPFTFLLPYITA
jgi:hypothetical protein